MVTAEFAVVLPSLVFVVAAAIGGVIAVTDELRCTDTVTTAARMAARGEPMSTVRAAALRDAPHGAVLQVTSTATTVTATVVVRVGASGWLGRLPHLTIRQRAVAPREGGVTEP
ncbi:MAG TPA: TadE family type IV pilus minor pilin [Mycobacteriales bacterium]|nr:TadE family type IV pilus minor pilin [Mycobacteriales bacterium]